MRTIPRMGEGTKLSRAYHYAYIFLNVGAITRRGEKAASNSCPFKELNYLSAIRMATGPMPIKPLPSWQASAVSSQGRR